MIYLSKLNLGKGVSFLALLVLLCQCTTTSNNGLSGIKNMATKVAVGQDSIIKLEIQNVTDTIDMFLSDFVEALEVIQLEDNEDAYVGASHTVVSPNYIGVVGNSKIPFKLFDRKSGKFITNIGYIGRGPGEYFAIYSAQIDEPNQRIYLLPWMQTSVLVYDLQGNVMEPIPVPYNMPKAHLRVDGNTKTLIIGVLPFEGIKSVAWKQDFNGNILSEVPSDRFTLVPDYSNEINTGNNVDLFDISFLTWDGKPDSLYNFIPQENRLKPTFTIDFNYTPGKTQKEKYNFALDTKAPIHTYYELPKYFMASFSFPQKAERNNWTTTAPVLVMVDKQSLKSAFLRINNDFLGGIKAEPFFQQGHYIYNNEPGQLIKSLDKSLNENKMSAEMNEKVLSLKKSINEEGNNIIIIGKMK